MRTSDPEIFAVGECVEHRGQVFGLVAPLWDQAKVCAARLAGDESAVFASQALSTSLKITGVDVFSAGALMAADEDDDEITLRDDSRGLYKKIVLRDGKLVGAVLYGDVADGPWYLQLMRDKEDVSALRERLVFGRAFAEAGERQADRAGLRRHARRHPDLRLQRRVPRARSSAPSATRSSLRCPRCAPTPRPRPPAANAPVWSRACSPSPRASTRRRRKKDAVRLHRGRP